MAAGDRDRWNEKWSATGVGTSHGSKLVDLLAPWLPTNGRLLDIAGGGSADSLEFARRGLDVTVADVSDIGLATASERSLAAGFAIQTAEVDLELEPLPAGPWDVITVANYLQRDLFPAIVQRLSPGGILGVVIATTTNLERNDKPGRPFLLEPDELPGLLPDLEILHHSEDWRTNGRHEAQLTARA